MLFLGTMSGGGKTVRRGGMGRSAVAVTSPAEIKKLESNLSNMENQLHQLQQRQDDLEQQIKVLEPELLQMKVTFKKYSVELNVITALRSFILVVNIIVFLDTERPTS